MPTELVTVNLTRENEKEDWGFELAGGGRDKNVRLFIDQVKAGSIAEKVGLKVKDSLVKIGNDCALDYTIEEALESLKRGKDFFDMIVEREAPDVVLQHEVIEDPRYLGLKREDRQKVGFHDVSKPTLRKDWNCPWIRRDGKGIKQVVRAPEPVPAPIRTSHNHFYSEPGSILAPDGPPMAPEELEKLIQERMGLVQKEEELKKEAEKPKKDDSMQQPQPPQVIQEERFEQNKMEVEFSHQQQQHVQEVHLEENGELDEEDSCPPDLEAVDVVPPQQQQQQQQQVQPQQQQQQQEFQLEANSELIRNLCIALKTGMEAYQGTESYEPSADELIDVLKNLENLAALNPALYRAIVDQIKGNQVEDQVAPPPAPPQDVMQTNGHCVAEDHDQVYNCDEVDQQQQVCYEEQVHMQNGTSAEQIETEQQHAVVEQKSLEQLKQEEKEARIAKEVEKEHEEQMRQLKEKKRKEKEPPPPPKTITVMAGSRNRSSWPPGIANANSPKVITLTSGEDEEELYKNRLEVAQAAGLKHIDVIHGDEGFYPTPMKDFDYPWAGSLRPTSKQLMKGKGGRGGDQDGGASPWAGSLRHVDPNKLRKKSKKHDPDDDELYGSAPWMGTLRHVKHENKVMCAMAPKFKKYPDEDAPNPFEGMQGRDAKPVYPLTPAAVIPVGGSSAEAKKNRRELEEVERITSGLRETRTVSSSLLKVLMPKLLKEHESKYEPLGHDESFKIMEEILAMQVGITPDGMVEDNDEAEQIIRAITHGEIDKAVYSQMADDLETAAQVKRKETKSKKKKKKKTAGLPNASTSDLATSASESTVVGSTA